MGDTRSLTIKTGTLRRLYKELEMYRKEEESESQKVKTLREKQADPHDIKYAENILSESRAMVPDTEQRLKAAVTDLSQFLSTHRELEGTVEYETAQRELSAVEEVLC